MALFPAVFGLLMAAAAVTGQNVEIYPKEAVQRVGSEVVILSKVPYPIDSCRVSLGEDTYRLSPDVLNGEVVYHGRGFQEGECGAHLKNIKEQWNGEVKFYLPPEDKTIPKEVTVSMNLIIARPPGNPQLIIRDNATFKEGENLVAKCVVPNGRPAATIKWFLDDDEILTDLHQAVLSTNPETGSATISQNITRRLSADDANRKLICRAEHQAMDTPQDATLQLIVHYPPKALESKHITIFGLKIGSEGRLDVPVRASPEPSAEWTVSGSIISAPHSSADGRMTALSPVHLGRGFYNVTLVLNPVLKEDVDQAYNLRVRNELGDEHFILRISTLDEPVARKASFLNIDVYGVELGTGAIVGIVIAVLILLIAVSLVVFAKVTQRWCFAGGARGRDLTKNSGESTPAGDVLIESMVPEQAKASETESAAGGGGGGRGGAFARGRAHLTQLSARMRSVLPRGRDKVQATEAPEPEDKPLSEEKKGVVYAELVLSEQPSSEKPAPPTTEYAEIVYTDETSKPQEIKE